MENKITENTREDFAIELLGKSGYEYIYAPSIAPDSNTPERESFEDVLLIERLQAAVVRINPEILKKDFYNSLCASFEPAEVEQQLSNTGLTGLSVKIVSDRHLIVYGEVE